MLASLSQICLRMSLLPLQHPVCFQKLFFLFEVIKAGRSWAVEQRGNVRVDNHRGVGCGSERASRIYCIRPSFRTSWRPELAGPQYAGDFAIAYCDQRMLWLDVFIMVLVVDFG